MSASSPQVHIVDDDEAFRDSLVFLLESHDYAISCHASAEALLEDFQPVVPVA
jgi:FixJ family two-component response regulator